MTPPTSRTPHPAPAPRPEGSTTLTARCPEDLLAAVPVVFGFHPSESVVMLTLGAVRQFHARVDLPPRVRGPAADLTLHRDLDELADTLLAPVLRHGVRSVVLVLYTRDAALADLAARALRRAFRDQHVEVLPMLRAHDGRWWSCPAGSHGVPADGVPYDLADHPFAAQAVYDGRVTLDSRAELAATVQPDRAEVVAVEQALARLGPVPSGTGSLQLRARRARDTVVTHVEAGTDPGPEEAAELLLDLLDLEARDAAWMTIRRHRARDHVRFWAGLVRRAPAGVVAAPATLLAWSAWQGGDGALAWCALDRCAEEHPDYWLAGTLADMLTRAVPPSAVDGLWESLAAGEEAETEAELDVAAEVREV